MEVTYDRHVDPVALPMLFVLAAFPAMILRTAGYWR
jgi:hypothetical protein